MRFAALILAGGRSRRMGSPKEALPLHGTTMLGWQIETMSPCTSPVVVVARDTGQALPPVPDGCDVIFDETPDLGPLAAIATGLRRLERHHGFDRRDAAMTVGCDQPYLTARTVRWLRDRLGDEDLLLPRAAGKLQPLTAVYRVGVHPRASELLAAGGRRPRELADVTACRILEEDELRGHDPELAFLRNLNHEADYQRALRELDRRSNP